MPLGKSWMWQTFVSQFNAELMCTYSYALDFCTAENDSHCRNVTQPLPREAYSEICRFKNMSRLPLIPPSVEQQIPNFQRDARHPPDSVPAAADALRDSFSSYEVYMRNQSAFGSFKVPIQYAKPSQLSRADPSMCTCVRQ